MHSLRLSPALPIIFIQEGCNDALEWYKSVKETHGSVEVTSFGKLKHILTYGHFHIGSQSRKVIQSIHEIVHLKLLKTGKQLPQMSYSLDDLRDLESKLVLITGSKAKNKEEVNQFLNVSINSHYVIVLTCMYQFKCLCFNWSPSDSTQCVSNCRRLDSLAAGWQCQVHRLGAIILLCDW